MSHQLTLFGERQLALVTEQASHHRVARRRDADLRARPWRTAPSSSRVGDRGHRLHRPGRGRPGVDPTTRPPPSPRRTLLAVDLENLLGRWGCLGRDGLAVRVRAIVAGLPPARFRVIAGNRTLLARTLHDLPPARLLPAAGRPDEADDLLLADLATVPAAVEHVVIASGDHAFVDACDAHRRAGRSVEVVALPGTLSSRLAHAADVVTLLHLPDLVAAA